MYFYLIMLLVLSIPAIPLHIFTLALLLRMRVQNLKGSQKYLMISLCTVQLTLSVGSVTLSLLIILDIENFISKFLACLNFTSLYLMFNFIMILITIDWLLEFKLNIKYPVYVSPKMTLLVIISLLVASLTVFVYVFVSNILSPWDYLAIFSLYVHVPFGGIFLTLAGFTYYIIFQKIQLNRSERKKIRRSIKDTEQSKTTFKLFLPSFIILTYIIFNLISSIVLTIEEHYFKSQGTAIMKTTTSLYPLGWVADPLIYIFSLKSIRMKLRRLYLQYICVKK